MKPLYLAGVAGAGVAVALAVMLLYAVPAQVVRVHQSGPFTASVLEDSSHRFLAKVENDGPP